MKKMRKRKLYLSVLCTLAIISQVNGQQGDKESKILEHEVITDEAGNLLPWYAPFDAGLSYDHIINRAGKFLLDIPNDPATGKKMYYITCCFQGPHMHTSGNDKAPSGILPEDWMHNPAGFYAQSVHSFARKLYQYSGNREYIEMVREMLDYQLKNGTTETDFVWGGVPYASSDPWDTIYTGAKKWQNDGMRGDGLYGVEPDKIGELGHAYLVFYQVSGEQRFLDAALCCADELAEHVRDVRSGNDPFIMFNIEKSPWPFRVNAKTGEVVSEYTSNVADPIRLFDELIRTAGRLELDDSRLDSYRKARDIALEWMYSVTGPMKTFIWNAYFEDIPNDPQLSNRNQLTPVNWAKYMISNPELYKDKFGDIPSIIHWVKTAFGDNEYTAIREQTWCYMAMGSHSSRYASLCAMWYELTGDEYFRDEAFNNFNYSTYMEFDNGVVAVGHSWPSSWFTDGYSDYVQHFLDGMAAIPEWTPVDQDHLLYSSSTVKEIIYSDRKIILNTYDDNVSLKFRLKQEPVKVKAGKAKKKSKTLDYIWNALESGGGVLEVEMKGYDSLEIQL